MEAHGGGGKSWAVRTKAILLSLRYPGIKLLIVRRTYPELMGNHIRILRSQLAGIAKYNDKDKLLRFSNGSTISFSYCACDKDLDRLQGVEYDIIFLDEATQPSGISDEIDYRMPAGSRNFPKTNILYLQSGRTGTRIYKADFHRPKIRGG